MEAVEHVLAEALGNDPFPVHQEGLTVPAIKCGELPPHFLEGLGGMVVPQASEIPPLC